MGHANNIANQYFVRKTLSLNHTKDWLFRPSSKTMKFERDENRLWTLEMHFFYYKQQDTLFTKNETISRSSQIVPWEKIFIQIELALTRPPNGEAQNPKTNSKMPHNGKTTWTPPCRPNQ